MKLHTHPRLYIQPDAIERARATPRLAMLKQCAQAVAEGAGRFKESPVFEWVEATHNAHLARARRMQARVVTLLVQWFRSGEAQYRDAAIRHLLQIGEWEYWSWITWRQGNPDPMAIYDLSYGENSATLAIGYDLLHDHLTEVQKQALRTIALERSIKPFLEHTKGKPPASRAWWMYHRFSNWNTVCAGGAGMLALAMYEDLPAAGEVLRRVERSFKPYMRTLTTYGGAWPEGIGYWNYGMRYAFMYLLSRQNATGRRHPLMATEGVVRTLRFPMDFTPHGLPCSFGDVNAWKPLPFHYAVAGDLGQEGVTSALDQQLSFHPGTFSRAADAGWPDAAEMLLLHPGKRSAYPPPRRHLLAFYKGQDWGVLADQDVGSRLYVTVRGGTTQVPHSHLDLMSYHLVVGNEHLIRSVGNGEYLDTTFSGRRWELPEMLPVTKNVMLINGVGITQKATVVTTPLTLPQAAGFHFEATEAMGGSRDGGAALFAGRILLLLRGKAVLVVDRAILAHAGRIETRFHTFAGLQVQADRVLLSGKRQKLTAVFACNEPAGVFTAVQAPTTPGEGAKVIRWAVQKLHTDMIMATLLVPGQGAASVNMTRAGDGVVLRCAGQGLPTTTVRLDRTLMPPSRRSPNAPPKRTD